MIKIISNNYDSFVLGKNSDKIYKKFNIRINYIAVILLLIILGIKFYYIFDLNE